MTRSDQRALVRDWNAANGWEGEEIDRGHEALLGCVDRAIEREFHSTGCAQMLEYYASAWTA